MRIHELTDRDGRLFPRIEHVGIRRWHPTIAATRPDTRLTDETIPTVDLGLFRSRKAATAAVNLVVTHWTWDRED